MCPTPPEALVTSTRSPRASRPCTNNACQAVSPPIGRAAASTWLSREGFGASTSAGTTAYSAATPSRSKGVSAYTSSPLPTTTPESSYEGIAGSRSTGHSSSPRVIAAACTRTSTSPGSGDGVSISSTFKPSSCSRTASTPLPCCPVLHVVLREILPSTALLLGGVACASVPESPWIRGGDYLARAGLRKSGATIQGVGLGSE